MSTNHRRCSSMDSRHSQLVMAASRRMKELCLRCSVFSRSLLFKSESRASEMITNVFRAMSDVYRDASVARNRLMDANISNILNHRMIVCALANKHPPFYVRYHEDVIIAWYNRDHTYIVMINRYIRRRRSPTAYYQRSH